MVGLLYGGVTGGHSADVTWLGAEVNDYLGDTGLGTGDMNGDGQLDADNPNYLKVPSFASGKKRSGPTGWLKTWRHDTRQDYRGMAPIHSGVVNVLMADGSVQSISDRNGDGFIR